MMQEEQKKKFEVRGSNNRRSTNMMSIDKFNQDIEKIKLELKSQYEKIYETKLYKLQQ